MSQSDHPLRRSSSAQDTAKKAQAPTTAGPTSTTAPLDQLQRAAAAPFNASPQAIATLQRQYGNRAVGGWLRKVQAKLNVGPVDDTYEREADRVADAVMSHTAAPTAPTTQRMEDEDELKRFPDIQAKGDEGGFEVSGDIESQLASRAGSGTALPDTARDKMESGFGQDFSRVRIHADSGAADISRQINAQAFTHGSDIYFGSGHYQPESQQGQHLLAHELTHVVQQTGSVQRVIRRRSDKIPAKATLLARASGGFSLGTTSYEKVLNAIDTYHKMGAPLVPQLKQLVSIYKLLVEWEIAHNVAATTTASKDTKEAGRRHVLSDVKADYLPKEIADVYGQAKAAPATVPVPLMMELMNASDGDAGVRATLQTDYAAALRTYNASAEDATAASSVIRGQGATILNAAAIGGADGWERDYNSMKTFDAEESYGMYGDIADIAPGSEAGKRMAGEEAAKTATNAMTAIEFMSLRAYSSHSYSEMNTEARRINPTVKGADKKAREKHAAKRDEAQQMNLMATSALNKLPPWNGSTLWRGEECEWGLKEGGPVQAGRTVVMPSLTSTSSKREIGESAFAGPGKYATLWEIRGIRASGSKLGNLAAIQDKDAENAEAEILLKPYSALTIVSVTPTPDEAIKFHVVATGT